MPSLSELPGSLNRKKFIKALRRLGFEIDTSGGSGSHIKVECPKNGKVVSVPSDLRKDVLKYVLKELENYSGITWEDIKKEL
ncbi:MAG: type II toxin-antitoxin system HicA family toxin [Candidatus Buchananbacteria bacterium]